MYLDMGYTSRRPVIAVGDDSRNTSSGTKCDLMHNLARKLTV
jgi:hypothetical protein